MDKLYLREENNNKWRAAAVMHEPHPSASPTQQQQKKQPQQQQNSFRSILRSLLVSNEIKGEDENHYCCRPIDDFEGIGSTWNTRINRYGKDIRFCRSCGICSDPLNTIDVRNSTIELKCGRHRAHSNCAEKSPNCIFCICDFCEKPATEDRPLIIYACGCMFHVSTETEHCMDRNEEVNYAVRAGDICCPFCSCVNDNNRIIPQPSDNSLARLKRDANDHLLFFSLRQMLILVSYMKKHPLTLDSCGISLDDLARCGLSLDMLLNLYFVPKLLAKPIDSEIPPILRVYPHLTIDRMLLSDTETQFPLRIRSHTATPVNSMKKLNTSILVEIGLTYEHLVSMQLKCIHLPLLDDFNSWARNYPEVVHGVFKLPDFTNSEVAKYLWKCGFVTYNQPAPPEQQQQQQQTSPTLSKPSQPQPQRPEWIKPSSSTAYIDKQQQQNLLLNDEDSNGNMSAFQSSAPMMVNPNSIKGIMGVTRFDGNGNNKFYYPDNARQYN